MNLFSLLLCVLAVTSPWQDPSINEINRCPMHATFDAHEDRVSLHGQWSFQFCGGQWGVIQVPGNWELQGYGDPLYLNVGYPWRGHAANTPGVAPSEHNYVGIYRRSFDIPFHWFFKDIFLTIGSATSCVTVRINGKTVGYSEDSKLEATFDITRYVRPGRKATIELEVRRWCDGTYMEDQDFWRLSGIARDSYLSCRPKRRIEDVRIKAGADGIYDIDAKFTYKPHEVRYFIDGKQVDRYGFYPGHQNWTAETPQLYRLSVATYNFLGKEEDRVDLDFGFRTVDIRGGQLLVNGKPVLIKGVNRHELSPTGGYVVSEEEMLRDIRIMKQLNVNAVRTCHYPNDPKWLALCDKYGIYVVDEANNESHGMGYGEASLAKNPAYALTHRQRVERMVRRDLNHPCVIVWSLGNEAGNGPNFEACYDWLKAFDTTRPVQYERALGNFKKGEGTIDRNTDICCPMYATYEFCERYCNSGATMPLIQCEYAHAMGNSMGGLKEYWDLVRKYPLYQGGFIWDFVDQALRWPSARSTTGYVYAFGGDFNDYDPSDNSFNCNGVIAADRSLHPHAYEVQHQYQNVWTRPYEIEVGYVEVVNENFFTSLAGYRLEWDITSDGEVVRSGVYDGLYAAPGQSQIVNLGFSLAGLRGELLLNVRYALKEDAPLLPAGTVVAHDQLALRGTYSGSGVGGSWVGGSAFAGVGHRVRVDFDKATGALASYEVGGREFIAEPLMPCFGRAVTENDLGAKLNVKMRQWQYPAFELVSLKRTADGGAKVVYRVGDLCSVSMDYTVGGDGSLHVRERMYDVREGAPDMFRFGVECALDGAFENIRFYGAGPWESYPDRKSSAAVGIYSQKVAEQYHYGYVRPQESGTHVDLRWMELTDAAGVGVRICGTACGACGAACGTACGPCGGSAFFSASALPFARRDIDMTLSGGGRKDRGDQRHSLELRPDVRTHLNVDQCQMGLGCINSWGRLPREEYMIHAGERCFEFVIIPIIY